MREPKAEPEAGLEADLAPRPQAGTGRTTRRVWLHRLGWMAALWAGGVFALAAVAYVIRTIMHALGMR